MHKYVIIVAGGKGERMGVNIPKQFLPLDGKPILMHTIEKFNNTFPDIKIILTLPNNQLDYWEGLCKDHSFKNIPYQIANGGETRFHSVKNSLAFIQEKSIVAIHDGVRPLASSNTIETCFKSAQELGNAIPTIDMVDSLRKVHKEENEAVPRSCYKAIQTPQCFQSAIILDAYQQEFNNSFTDDASVVEANGNKINLVEGNRENIKITNQLDLVIAESLLRGV